MMSSGEMTVGWEIKKLGEVCHVIGGGTPSKSNEEFYTGEIPWATVRDMKNEIISQTEYRITEEAIKKSSTNIIKKGNVVIATRVGLGKVCMIAEDTAINQDLRGIIPKNNNQILVRFLFWWLKSIAHLIKQEGTGATVQGVKVTFVNSLKIPIPPLPEQKRIVAIADEAFEGIDRAIRNTEKNLSNARELFESYLNSIFTQKGDGWEEKKLEDICSIKHGFAFKGEFFTTDKSKYILLTPGSFYESGGYRNQGEKTKYYIGEIPDSFILKKGDFLFAMTEQAVGLLGSSLIVTESDKFLHNQRLGLVEVKNDFKWHNDFFFHQFNTKNFRAAVQSSASGVKVRHTSPKKLGAIPVYFPSTIAKQKVIADNLNELYTETQRLENIYRQKIAALKELKQSILQKAFTGELTVRLRSPTTADKGEK